MVLTGDERRFAEGYAIMFGLAALVAAVGLRIAYKFVVWLADRMDKGEQ